MNPILSIGIPTYNRPNQIKILIESILSQKNIGVNEIEINISDNSENDITKKLIEENYLHQPNIKYYKNEINIGSERNIRRVFSLGNAIYTWLIPDDDKLTYDYSLSEVITQIKNYNQELTFIMVNAKAIYQETNTILAERFNEVNKNIFFEDGKDLLNMITDSDLIGAQRLIIKRSILPHPFEQKHTQDGNVGCMSLALVAAAAGKTLFTGSPLITFEAGDSSPWRKFWPKIFFLDMSNLLIESIKDLGYSEKRLMEIIEDKKYKHVNILNPQFLLFQKYGLKWSKLIELYGTYFLIRELLKAPFRFVFNSRLIQKITK